MKMEILITNDKSNEKSIIPGPAMEMLCVMPVNIDQSYSNQMYYCVISNEVKQIERGVRLWPCCMGSILNTHLPYLGQILIYY